MAGRRCDTCAPGFHGFPSCRPCDCHEAGSAPGMCDPLTGQCYCKVRGPLAQPAPHPIPHLVLSAEVCPFWEAGASWNTLGQPAQLQGDRQHWLDPLHMADYPALPCPPTLRRTFRARGVTSAAWGHSHWMLPAPKAAPAASASGPLTAAGAQPMPVVRCVGRQAGTCQPAWMLNMSLCDPSVCPTVRGHGGLDTAEW